MAKVNMSSIRKKIVSAKKTETRANAIANRAFLESKNEFIQEFNSHPVTQEIEQGPKGSNVSNTLGGIGNLFSFIGFDKSENPVQDLRTFILQRFKLNKGKKIETGKNISYKYRIQYPGIEDLKSISPMPWESGRSWVSAIEKGISGFSNYMYKTFSEGRSGEGLQTDNKIRSATYKPTQYMSQIILKFVKNLRTNIK